MSSSGTSGKKRFMAILPAPARGSSSTANGRSMSNLPPKRQKRTRTGRSACDACRRRKSACDGRRPTCSTCTKRQSQCVYTLSLVTRISLDEQKELNLFRKQKNDGAGKQQEDSIAADVLESVRSLPENQALLLFHRLRASRSSNDTVSLNTVSKRGNQGLITDRAPKAFITANDIRPPSRLSMEYELMLRHPVLYPLVSPATQHCLPVASAAKLSGWGERVPVEKLSSFLLPQDPVEPSKYPIQASERQRTPSPNHSDLCDERLALFNVHNWLQVPVRSELAARAVSFYLTTDHPILGLFDVDLFLDDLVARRTDFCSPLLLSAVLSVACQGYTAVDTEAAGYSHVFFAEAERLYSEEKQGGPQCESATMTIAAARLLCAAATYHGHVRLASRYILDGIQMAHENGLLAVQKPNRARRWLDGNINNIRAAAHAAWGTFCTTVFFDSSCWNAPIDIKPWLPIPGTTIEREGGSTIPFHLPPYMGQSFTQFCRLAPLINRILQRNRLAPNEHNSSSLMEKTYLMLLQWSDSLPIAMGPGTNMAHHVAIMHIQFHTAVVDLFRPSLQVHPKQVMNIDSLVAEDRTVENICTASINQLKHLVLVFRNRYAFAPACFLWHNALLYVANDCVSKEHPVSEDGSGKGEMETVRSNSDVARNITWFMACVDGYKALAPQFPIVSGIMQGLLSMGIENGLMTAAEGRAYMEEANLGAGERSRAHMSHSGELWMRAQNFSSRFDLPDSQDNFIIDLNGAMADPIAASIDALSHRFNQITMMDELSASDTTTSPN